MELKNLVSRLWEASQDFGENDNISVLLIEAANAIEDLQKAAQSMHTWIFLHSDDEQTVYDECGLSDEMNAALGYGGQFVAEILKDEPSSD